MPYEEETKDNQKVAAILRYYYKVEVNDLSDEELAKLWHEYLYVKKCERAFLLNILRTVVSEAFGKNA